jgi:hypothetical protein
MPVSSGEVPTGAIQFQDDWPGLFIRGEECASLFVYIRALQDRLSANQDPVVAAALLPLEKIADVIERDVIVRREDTTGPG